MSNQTGGTGTLSRTLADNPAAQRLKDEAQRYAQAMAQHAARSATQRVTDLAGKLTDVADGGSLGGKGLKELAGGKSPVKAVGSAVTDKLGEGVKSMFGGKKGGSGGKTVNILEQIDIGLPREQVYNQWTQFQEFGRITKGVESAEQTEETKINWRAKIAWSSRSWESTIREQVPDQRIAWTSKGSKGSVDGVVTFHELTPDLTRVLLDLQYHPQGLFEKTGNIWRAQGRRVRLDLKKFREFVMTQDEPTGAWRGEIRDGEVVDDGAADAQDAGGRDDEQRRDQQRDDKQRGDQQGDEEDSPDGDGERGGRRSSSRQGSGQRRRRSEESSRPSKSSSRSKSRPSRGGASDDDEPRSSRRQRRSTPDEEDR